MGVDSVALVCIGALLASMYFFMGLGVARMLAKIKSRELRISDICFWPVACGVFATIGDCG